MREGVCHVSGNVCHIREAVLPAPPTAWSRRRARRGSTCQMTCSACASSHGTAGVGGALRRVRARHS
eukprot:1053685-Prymnesium_polylepis.1